MATFNYPKKAAYVLAKQMRKFLVKTESTVHSEINVNADHDRAEVVRQIDWAAFGKIMEQLEFCYVHDQKNKGIR